MQEANKSITEKGIKSEEVKNLPPIETLCEPIPHPPMVEVNSLYKFDASDVPYDRPPWMNLITSLMPSMLVLCSLSALPFHLEIFHSAKLSSSLLVVT